MRRPLIVGRLLKDNSGFALILTILIISLIVALTLQFNSSMWSNLHASTNLRDGIRLGYIARSGFDCALAVLSEDAQNNDFDSLRDDWAYLKPFSYYSSSIFEDGRFEVQIIDHSGRIQINQLVKKAGEVYKDYDTTQKALFKRFLNSDEFGLDGEEVEDILEAIKDWIDSDNDVTGFGGAEDSHYQALEEPYSCGNGRMESLEELLLVRGITKEIFYGTEEKPGISNYLTNLGDDGKININTADPLVLRSLSEDLDQEMAEDMVTYREDEENELKDPKWYKQVPGTSDVNIDDLVTTSSNYFEIISEGVKEAMSKRVTGMVKRKQNQNDPDPFQLLSWKIE